jgi:hypothetical protein
VKVKRGRGRPTKYTPELADEICARLAVGESLRSICRDEHMPDERAVRDWVVNNHHGFSTQYTHDRDLGLDSMGEEVIEIADDSSRDTYTDDEGVERTDHDHINRSRLRVDARKWYLSKLAPKRYGERTTIEAEVKTDAPLLDPVQAARLIVFSLRLAEQMSTQQEMKTIEAST